MEKNLFEVIIKPASLSFSAISKGKKTTLDSVNSLMPLWSVPPSWLCSQGTSPVSSCHRGTKCFLSVYRKIQCHPPTFSVQKWSQAMQNNISPIKSFCCLIIVGVSVQFSLQGWWSAAESAQLSRTEETNQEESGRGRKWGSERELQVGGEGCVCSSLTSQRRIKTVKTKRFTLTFTE